MMIVEVEVLVETDPGVVRHGVDILALISIVQESMLRPNGPIGRTWVIVAYGTEATLSVRAQRVLPARDGLTQGGGSNPSSAIFFCPITVCTVGMPRYDTELWTTSWTTG